MIKLLKIKNDNQIFVLNRNRKPHKKIFFDNIFQYAHSKPIDFTSIFVFFYFTP